MYIFKTAAYVLDLRAKFSLASELPSNTDGAWRERVLGLEQDVAFLKMKYNQERISKRVILMASMDLCVFTCRSEALSSQSGDAGAPPVASTSTIIPVSSNKKKLKHKFHPNAVSRIDLEAVLGGMSRKYHNKFSCVVFFWVTRNCSLLSRRLNYLRRR
jgi:hypothetical protein